MISLNLTILITVINFAVLYWLFKRFLLSRIVEFLDGRSEEIAATRAETRSENEKAKELRKEAGERLKRARLEAGDVLKEARIEGTREGGTIVSRAKDEAERMMEKARDEIEKKAEDARAKLKREVAGLSIDIAEKLLERSVNVEDHEKSVAEFMEELKEKE